MGINFFMNKRFRYPFIIVVHASCPFISEDFVGWIVTTSLTYVFVYVSCSILLFNTLETLQPGMRFLVGN